jgi:hypothetical protein
MKERAIRQIFERGAPNNYCFSVLSNLALHFIQYFFNDFSSLVLHLYLHIQQKISEILTVKVDLNAGHNFKKGTIKSLSEPSVV